MSFTRAIRLNPNAIEKKEGKKNLRVIACKHIRRSRWFRDRYGRRIGYFERALPFSCDATRVALPKRRARHGISLLRGIHSTREIAPPRTKRNGLRRFYYTALKPGRLPLQSYRSKLQAGPFTTRIVDLAPKIRRSRCDINFRDIEKSRSRTRPIFALFENHIEKLSYLKIVHDVIKYVNLSAIRATI